MASYVRSLKVHWLKIIVLKYMKKVMIYAMFYITYLMESKVKKKVFEIKAEHINNEQRL